jgi:hypothetical protein
VQLRAVLGLLREMTQGGVEPYSYEVDVSWRLGPLFGLFKNAFYLWVVSVVHHPTLHTARVNIGGKVRDGRRTFQPVAYVPLGHPPYNGGGKT